MQKYTTGNFLLNSTKTKTRNFNAICQHHKIKQKILHLVDVELQTVRGIYYMI
jgi:peptide subunit release factor 1 (eRF1)